MGRRKMKSSNAIAISKVDVEIELRTEQVIEACSRRRI